ncbi:MAG: ATPase [Deltaproteobacteria bacterium]|nr:ATPase [Deltaproteobacteria bacterium]
MTRVAKRYNIDYKKRVDKDRDTYLPRWSPGGVLYCRGCGSTYYRRRWTLQPPQEVLDWGAFRNEIRFALCPACRKLREHYPSGELRLVGVPAREEQEVFRLLRNEEERAREKNPLERIMRIQRDAEEWRVETTTEKLAQRLGRCVRKARGGKVVFKWSHNRKFARVLWQKEAAVE